MGTECIEVKLLQQLSHMVHKTLYFIFLDLQKAYNTVDREQLLEILEGYGVGPNVLDLLKLYWDNQHCVIPRRDFCPLLWCNKGRCCFPYSLQYTCRYGGAEMADRCYGQHDNYKRRSTK